MESSKALLNNWFFGFGEWGSAVVRGGGIKSETRVPPHRRMWACGSGDHGLAGARHVDNKSLAEVS
jgi:hypothetical protein